MFNKQVSCAFYECTNVCSPLVHDKGLSIFKYLVKYVFSVYGILLDGLHCIYSRYIQNTIFYIYYILLICTHLQTFKNILHLYTI